MLCRIQIKEKNAFLQSILLRRRRLNLVPLRSVYSTIRRRPKLPTTCAHLYQIRLVQLRPLILFCTECLWQIFYHDLQLISCPFPQLPALLTVRRDARSREIGLATRIPEVIDHGIRVPCK